MKVLLSPAKSLDFDVSASKVDVTTPLFLEHSKTIHKVLKSKSPQDLSQLMKISDALGELNYNRNQNWQLPFTPDNAKPAVYVFNGGVYKGLQARSIAKNNITNMQHTLRIISGLYGMLKPMDLIQPYRLEMGTKLEIHKSKNLYDFWRTTLTEALNDDLSEHELLLNLASNEYFKAIDVKSLKVPPVHVMFKDLKHGVYKTISFFAKEARGLMARYIIDENIKTKEGLKDFNGGGYAFSNTMSKENTLVFIRS